MRSWLATIALIALTNAAFAQSRAPAGMPPPAGMSLAASAAMRFPQPVRVGDLVGRIVQRPVESQDYVGTVRRLVRNRKGTVLVVIDAGGWFGFGARPIAVPVDAMVLVGRAMEVVAYTPAQLDGLPSFAPGGTTPLAADTVIRVGLAKPSH